MLRHVLCGCGCVAEGVCCVAAVVLRDVLCDVVVALVVQL